MRGEDLRLVNNFLKFLYYISGRWLGEIHYLHEGGSDIRCLRSRGVGLEPGIGYTVVRDEGYYLRFDGMRVSRHRLPPRRMPIRPRGCGFGTKAFAAGKMIKSGGFGRPPQKKQKKIKPGLVLAAIGAYIIYKGIRNG